MASGTDTKTEGGKGDFTTMKRTHSLLFISFGLTVAAIATVGQAQATLGESVDSITADSKALSAVQGATKAFGSYTVYEVSSNAIVIREYVSASGIVFGIAWNGPAHLDLTTLLGSYADEYQKAQSKTPRQPGRRHFQVKTDRVVVERWGHMRNLRGRAYVPDLIPQGASVDEIK